MVAVGVSIQAAKPDNSRVGASLARHVTTHRAKSSSLYRFFPHPRANQKSSPTGVSFLSAGRFSQKSSSPSRDHYAPWRRRLGPLKSHVCEACSPKCGHQPRRAPVLRKCLLASSCDPSSHLEGSRRQGSRPARALDESRETRVERFPEVDCVDGAYFPVRGRFKGSSSTLPWRKSALQ